MISAGTNISLPKIKENKHRPVPLKVFEVSDVAYKAPELERKTRNERHFAAAWYGKTSGFEVVHGLLDRIMAMLDIAFADSEKAKKNPKVNQYWIEELDGMYSTLVTLHTRSRKLSPPL
jgi:phenylalanyl-tRNA synthetase beta chain